MVDFTRTRWMQGQYTPRKPICQVKITLIMEKTGECRGPDKMRGRSRDRPRIVPAGSASFIELRACELFLCFRSAIAPGEILVGTVVQLTEPHARERLAHRRIHSPLDPGLSLGRNRVCLGLGQAARLYLALQQRLPL
jgi:hypothetical protein